MRDRYGTPLVVALGRLVYYKGYDVLIAAAAAIHGNVLIIGSGPLGAELRQAASGLDNVQFAGYVAESELPGYLAAATCFVQPSTSCAESFGIATVEAQAMGVPAVVTDVGTGTVETVAPDVTGYVVGPGDPAALASRVNDVLDDRPRADRMGREATKRAREHNGRSGYAEQLAAIYRSLAN